MSVRFAANILVQNAHNWLRNRVIEQDDDLRITEIFDLTQMQSESARTLFFDGIITPFPLLIPSEEEKTVSEVESIFSEKSSIQTKKNFLNRLTDELRQESGKDLHQVFDECIFRPYSLSDINCEINKGVKLSLVLWQNIDLREMKLTSNLQIRLLSFPL